MRFISLMGMVFLPGTFLAVSKHSRSDLSSIINIKQTLFSMTFFNWTPTGNDQILSPWVVLYFGLTAITTAFLIWFSKQRSIRQKDDEETQFIEELEVAKNLMDLASLRRSNSAIGERKDDESEIETMMPATP